MRRETIEQARDRLGEDLGKFAGWCGEEKSLRLFNTVLDLNPSVVVEVGVYGGRSLAAMAWASLYLDHTCRVYGFDAWSVEYCVQHQKPETDPVDKEQGEFWKSQDLRAIYYKMLEALEAEGLIEAVIPINETSSVASDLFTNDTIDMLHLDANHTEWASTQDVLNWLPKVRSGGIVCLDDTNFPSLQTAIRFTLQECDEVYSPEDKQYTIYKKR